MSDTRRFHVDNTPSLVLALIPTLLLLNSLRAQFPLPDDFNPGPNNGVLSLAVQPDGKILVGGAFTTLDGEPRAHIGRLNSDGTLDNSFNPEANDWVYSLVLQTDGKILVGGGFTTLGGHDRSGIARLNADGTVDDNFKPGAFDSVSSIAIQADGKILVGDSFITRLNADGTRDNTFKLLGVSNSGVGSWVESLAVQADGKILVGGHFTVLGERTRNYIGRLNADGTLDNTFNPGANSFVRSLLLQADEKILVGGSFSALGGQPRNYIGRLNQNGTLDTTFNPGASGGVLSLAGQADGKILVGGFFTTLGGEPRNNLGRLNQDGSLDGTFDPRDLTLVYSLALQADGKALVGGSFLGVQTRARICRMNSTDPATQTLSYDGTTITWWRGGTSPEVWRTAFEHSVDGLTWTNLGPGERISGGWRLNDVSLRSSGILRARGHSTGGYANSSAGIVETTLDLAIRLRLFRDGSKAILSWTGRRGPYQVQQSLDASQPDLWQDLGAPVLTNSISLPIGPGTVFLRVREQ